MHGAEHSNVRTQTEMIQIRRCDQSNVFRTLDIAAIEPTKIN
jgi:hypothetical protein